MNKPEEKICPFMSGYTFPVPASNITAPNGQMQLNVGTTERPCAGARCQLWDFEGNRCGMAQEVTADVLGSALEDIKFALADLVDNTKPALGPALEPLRARLSEPSELDKTLCRIRELLEISIQSKGKK